MTDQETQMQQACAQWQARVAEEQSLATQASQTAQIKWKADAWVVAFYNTRVTLGDAADARQFRIGDRIKVIDPKTGERRGELAPLVTAVLLDIGVLVLDHRIPGLRVDDLLV